MKPANSQRWRTYLTTVDEIEKNTGYDFLSEVSKNTQKAIEAKVDNQNTDTKTETKITDNKDAKQTTESTKQNTKDGRTYILGERGASPESGMASMLLG